MKNLLKKPLVILILIGIVYRLMIIVFYHQISIFPDSEGYQLLAKMISNWDFSHYEGERSPGYPLLLALSANSIVFLVGIQLVIGVANSVLVFQNLKLLQFNEKSALLIALFLDTLLHVVFYELSILTESLTLFLISCIINIMLRGHFVRTSAKTSIILSFVIAWLVLVKPFYIFVPILIYGFSILKDFKSKAFLCKSQLLILIIPLSTFLGWSYVNKIHTGYFVPTTMYGFYISQTCVYFAEKAPAEYSVISEIYVRHREETIRKNGDVAMSIWYAHPDLQKTTGLSFADLSFELNAFSKATIKKNPVDYLKQVKTSWLEFWRTVIYWDINSFKIKKAAPVFTFVWQLQHYLLRIFKILFLVNLPLLLIQFIKKRHFSPEIMITIIIVVTSLLQAFSTFGTNSRFSYPFESLMVIIVLLQIRTFFHKKRLHNFLHFSF